jgi:hypothetical protein
MIYKLRMNDIETTIPTIGFNVERSKHKNVDLIGWDIGGPDKVIQFSFFSYLCRYAHYGDIICKILKQSFLW